MVDWVLLFLLVSTGVPIVSFSLLNLCSSYDVNFLQSSYKRDPNALQLSNTSITVSGNTHWTPKMARVISQIVLTTELWRKKIWNFIPVCIFWTAWKERNRLAFRGGSLDIQKFKNSFVCNLWSWARVYNGEETYSLLGFLEWLATTWGWVGFFFPSFFVFSSLV